MLDDGELHYRNMRKIGGGWLAGDQKTLDEIVGRIGPDWLERSLKGFRKLLAPRRGSTKSALMDQKLAAGLGNLTADESLWRARLDPRRPVASLDDRELERLYGKLPEGAAGLDPVRARAIEAHCGSRAPATPGARSARVARQSSSGSRSVGARRFSVHASSAEPG